MTGFFDEMLGNEDAGGMQVMRDPYEDYGRWFKLEDPKRIHLKAAQAEAFFRKTGITFNVYGSQDADERLIPFDVVPRIISAGEWRKLSRGIEQRVRALNAFLHDIYHRQEILRAGRVPVELIANNEAFLPQMVGVEPPGGIFTHIVGTDLSAPGRMNSLSLRTTPAPPPVFPTCSKTARPCCICFPSCLRRYRCAR